MGAAASAADALRQLVVIGTALQAGEKFDRHLFAMLMHYIPLADFRHHNVGRDFRDALHDVATGCTVYEMAAVLGVNVKEAYGEAKDELLDNEDGGDPPSGQQVKEWTRRKLCGALEDKFCFCGDDGFGDSFQL